MFNPEKLELLIKCRLCGETKIQPYLPRGNSYAYVSFAQKMKERSVWPEQAKCEKCNLFTLHDLVAFSPPAYDYL